MLEELTLKKAVEFAIKTEELGGKFYGRLSKKFADNAVVKGIFTILAQEEGKHRRRFAELLEAVPAETASSGPESFQYLRAMSISEFFAGEEGLLAKADDAETADDALHAALGLEKATLGFYEAMRDALGDDAILMEVIAEEKKHVTGLLKYIITGAEVRGLPEEVDEADFR